MNPVYDVDGIQIWHADCADVLPSIEPKSVALLLTDPPYGMNYESSDLWERRGVEGDDEPFDPRPLLTYGRCVIFGAEHFAARLPVSKGWIVWEKRNDSDSTDSGLKVPYCELAWTNVNGRHRAFNELWAGPLRRERFLHPTQKSVNLMRWIVEQWTEPGDLVLDPYMGSGPVARACADLGRRYVGIEIVEEYVDAAIGRLGQLTLNINR